MLQYILVMLVWYMGRFVLYLSDAGVVYWEVMYYI